MTQDAFADEKYVEDRVKFIKETPNAFALVNTVTL